MNYDRPVTPPITTSVAGPQLAAAFSPAVLKGLASADARAVAPRLAPVAAMAPNPEATLGEAFDAALKSLVAGHRSEYVFKNQIISKVVFGRHSPRTASALLELPMGQSVADVVVLNGTSTTYEVKTDLDQFTRLSTQLDDYARDRKSVV